MNTLSLLSIREVAEVSGISKPTIYRRMKAGDFPRPVKLSPNRVAWYESEILAWLESRPVSEGF